MSTKTAVQWNGYSITALSTLQMAAPGHGYTLLGPAQDAYDTHLVRVADRRGTPGPTLCGLDRFADGSPGWSVGGGVSGPGIQLVPCPGCVEVARVAYPGLPVQGSVGQAEVVAAVGGESKVKDHLLHPLADGGHGFSEASYGVVWTDSDEFHEYDHSAGTWFSEALLHNHEAAP